MRLDDEREIEETRFFFAEHGLLPDLPDQSREDEQDAQRLLQKIITTSHVVVGTPWRSVGWIAAAAVVVAVMGGVFALLRSAPAVAAGTPAMLTYSAASPQSIGSAPPATGPLASAAKAVIATPPTQGTGDVQYLAAYGWLLDIRVDFSGSTNSVIYPTFTQWWLAPDGAVRLDERRGTPLSLDGQIATPGHEGQPGAITSETSPIGTIDPDLAARLSTDSASLRAELLDTQAGLPCGRDVRWQAECLISAIQMIYQQYVVSPELASAMWDVLAGEHALRSLGTAVDRLGRPVTAVALTPEPDQQAENVVVLLISTDTGKFLGTETITIRDPALGISTPTVTAFSEQSTSQRVAILGDTP